MASPAPRSDFVQVPSDTEALELAGELAVEGRSLGPRSLRRRLLLGAVAAASAGAVALAAAALRPRPAAGAINAGAELQAFAKPFKQCGGLDWTGTTCCQAGCACVTQTRFYSQCEVPAGAQDCDMMAASSEVEEAARKMELARPAAEEAEAKAKVAEARSAKAKARSAKAHAPLQRLIGTYKAKKAAKEAAERQEKHLKALADAAGKKAWGVEHDFNETQKKDQQFDRDFALADSGLCAGMFGSCGGQLKPGMKACCQMGCQCVWKDNFYAQCHAPPGKPGCDPAAEKALAAATKKKFVELKAEHATTSASNSKATKAWRAAAAKGSKLREELEAAEKAKDEALEIAKAASRVAEATAREAKATREAATHAAHAIKYAKHAVKAWQAAADGAACHDEGEAEDGAEEEAVEEAGGDGEASEEEEEAIAKGEESHELRFLKN